MLKVLKLYKIMLLSLENWEIIKGENLSVIIFLFIYIEECGILLYIYWSMFLNLRFFIIVRLFFNKKRKRNDI